ncbi:hypothetical protein [Actinokineospora sp. HUAS TT18]|uniref:hypothetical protein n=1 Tax=Actinokineospora sp. HUAS TT18 TaxID=3447451 RepID=UPI003F526FDB
MLRALAYRMMSDGVREIAEADALAEFAPTLRRLSTTLTPEGFLAEVGSNGLLVERRTGVFSFALLTFQEYLAAEHIRSKDLVEVLESHVANPWWRETTLLSDRGRGDPAAVAGRRAQARRRADHARVRSPARHTAQVSGTPGR